MTVKELKKLLKTVKNNDAEVVIWNDAERLELENMLDLTFEYEKGHESVEFNVKQE